MKSMEIDIGNTHIEIWDDYVICDPVKVQEILDRIGKIGMRNTVSSQENNFNILASRIKAM